MKARSSTTNQNDLALNKELSKLNDIDTLSPSEVAAGDNVFEDSNDDHQEAELNNSPRNEINHDGVELSVRGSEDEFTEELGELVSSDEEDLPESSSRVASKVVRVNNKRTSKLDKFAHLRNDPDFRDFLKEIVSETKTQQTPERTNSKSQSRSRHDKGNNLVSHVQKSPLLVKSPSDTTIYMPAF